MKKIFIVLLLLLVPAFSCFAGSFYSNIVVLSAEYEKVLSVLLQLGITAYWAFKGKTSVIFEQKIDEQNTEYGENLAKDLSEKLNAITIYSTNHDSDILYMFIHKNGELLFSYDSDPGYFTGENLPPKIEHLDKLLSEYEYIDKNEFINILNSDEVFADDLHGKIAEILELPAYSVGLGYNYCVTEKEEMEIFFDIKIEKAGK